MPPSVYHVRSSPLWCCLSAEWLLLLTSGRCCAQHYMLAYRDSLAAVCAAQMKSLQVLLLFLALCMHDDLLAHCSCHVFQGGLMMRLLEGDEFVRGILEPAGLCLADVRRSRMAGSTSYRTLNAPLSTRRSSAKLCVAICFTAAQRGHALIACHMQAHPDFTAVCQATSKEE